MKDLGHRGYHHRCRQLLVGFLAHPRSSRITNVHSGEPRSTSELFTIPFLYLGEHTEESHWDIPPTVASNPRTLPSNFCKMRQPPSQTVWAAVYWLLMMCQDQVGKREQEAQWSGPCALWLLRWRLSRALCLCVELIYECLVVHVRNRVREPQSTSHNTTHFIKEKYFVLKSLLHVIISATVKA